MLFTSMFLAITFDWIYLLTEMFLQMVCLVISFHPHSIMRNVLLLQCAKNPKYQIYPFVLLLILYYIN